VMRAAAAGAGDAMQAPWPEACLADCASFPYGGAELKPTRGVAGNWGVPRRFHVLQWRRATPLLKGAFGWCSNGGSVHR
jgi:hypothetical protein